MISAKIICDSVSPLGTRLTTFELEYPRIIHAEFLTHSMLARNSASSRAIPFAKMVEQLKGKPVRFGKNQSGMQDAGEHNELIKYFPDASGLTANQVWEDAKDSAVCFAKSFADAVYHKQIVNRLTEPFQIMKTVVTATEWSNFFWLRNHNAADPTIEALAKAMYEKYSTSKPKKLQSGEWHLPYVKITYDSLLNNKSNEIKYYISGTNKSDIEVLTLEEAIKVSAARTAAVSFRNEEYTAEKCFSMYDRLVGDERKHASAFGHQCTPIKQPTFALNPDEDVNSPGYPKNWEEGITHVDRNGCFWSAMMRGWIQYRKLIPGENYTGKI